MLRAPAIRVTLVPCANVRFMSSAALPKVGFIGLGNMGRHMAANLLKAGHQVTVFDMSPAAVEALKAKGASAAKSAADVVEGSQAVITMLPSSPHVEDVFTNSLLKKMKAGTLFIDCSTIDPTVSRKLAAAGGKARVAVVDAPVSGGVGGAEAGTLTFMVGGTKEEFESAKAILAHMGKNIVHCGGAGTGQVAKLCNNLILGISMTAVSEAMNLGVTLGADPKVLASIVNTSSGRCWSSDTYNPVPGVMANVPSSRGYTGGFGVPLMKKDLALAADAAKSAGVPFLAGNTALNTYAEMSANNEWASKDFSSVYAYLASKSKKTA